jgi:hypothetical protein
MFDPFLLSLSAFLAADTAAIEPQGSVVAVGAVLPQVDLSIILPIGKDFSIARAIEESEKRCKVFFTEFVTYTMECRRIRLIDSNAKCRYLKKLACKGRCLSA